MGIEYKIKFTVPENYDPTSLFNQLPSPIDRDSTTGIYNYSIEADGFYFLDQLVNREVASVAFGRFIDEALRLSQSVNIFEPWFLGVSINHSVS